ncbi:MAG: phosphotransferase [Acidimicrobiia bacterium]
MNQEVLYPHRKIPWAAHWNDQGGLVHGLFYPATGERHRVEPLTDDRLPGLRLWMRQGQLVSYRPLRRASIRATIDDQLAFVKVVPPRRLPELAVVYERNLHWLKDAGVAVPELMLVDEASGALVLSALAGSSLHDPLGQQVDYNEIGEILGRLAARPAHRLPQRRPPDYSWWLQQVADWDPEGDGAFVRAVEQLFAKIGTVEPGHPGWEHGDLHDRNLFMMQPEGLGMIDLEQAGRGDSQADLVCLSAHLELRALQQHREPPEREIQDLWTGSGFGVFPPRVRKAISAELARLACLYRFRARWRPLTRNLLARAESWLQPVRPARPIPAIGRLRTALIPGRLAIEVAVAGFDWLGGCVTAVEVTRVGVAPHSFVLDLDVELGGGHRKLIAEIPRTGDPAAALTSTVESLGKKRRGQRPATGYGIGMLPGSGMVIRSAGLDRRLPVLRLLHIAPEQGGLVGAEVLSHRLGKRVTIRKSGGGIIKGYKSRSPLPETTFSLGGTLAATAPPLGGPQPLEILSELRAVVWQEETPAPPAQYEHPAPFAINLTGAALRQLHALEGFEGPRYDVALELDGIHRLARLVEVVRPDLKKLIAAAMAIAADRAGELEQSFERPIHRDAHPGQFIIGPDRALVIDVDTFATGDPAIDLGNYSAHLFLHGAEEMSEVLLEASSTQRAL